LVGSTSDSLGQTRGSFSSVSSSTLAEQVSHEIVKSILRGDLGAGSRLPSEKELSRQFDVSRPVIREAVQAVAMLGLVERRQGRGTRIAPRDGWRHLSPELLQARTQVGAVEDVLLELLELRRMVEVEAARLAARRATDRDLAAMLAHLDQMDVNLADPEIFTKHDVGFHGAMLRASGNNLPPLFEQLRPLLEFARALSARTRPGGPAESQRGHREVFEHIAAGHPDEAAQAMANHLSWTANLDFREREERLERQQHKQSARPGRPVASRSGRT
jgi:DNA-binding FadR family transcriptional regulator